MGANKITSTYVPVNDADILNKLYLTTNNYTKTQIDTNNYTKTATDTLLALKATITYVDTKDALKLSLTGTTTDLNMNAKNITNVNTISGTLLNIKNGNVSTGTGNNALTLEYSGGGYKHAIKSRHNGSSDDNGNAIDFYIWKVADTINTIGTKQLMSITSVGVGIFKNNPAYALDVLGTCYISGNTTIGGILNAGVNKITSTYVPINNEDVINKLYLTTNNYTKSESDTLLALKATISYVDTQDALKLNKSGGVMSGNLEILTAVTIPNLYISYNSLINSPTVDTDVGILRFYNQRSQNDKFCEVKAIIRIGQYTPSIAFATKPDWPTPVTNRMVITENGNIGINTMNPTTLFYVNGNATIAGTLNMIANKITSSYIPVNNEDLINKLYLTTNNYTKTQTDSNTTTALTTFLGTVNTFSVGQIFNSGIISNGNVDAGNNRVIANLAPVYNNDCANKLYVDNQIATIPTYYYNKTQTNSLLNAKANLIDPTFAGNVYAFGAIYADTGTGDNRAAKPSDTSPDHISYFFGSYLNNGGSNWEWSDCMSFNSYVDGSGGNQNLLMLSKSSPKIRVYQGGFGSTSTFTNYADALMVDSANILSNTVTASTTNNKLLTLSSANKLETRVIGGGIFPIFSVPAEQISNWGSGLIQNECFKTVKPYQTVMFSGHYGGYSTTGQAFSQVNLRFYIYLTTNYITFPLKFYVNTTYSHYTVPINFCYQFSEAGSYSAHIYVVSNLLTDTADMVYLNATVLF
jgi:hypothetical protein